MVEKLDLWQGHTLLLGYLLNITMGYGKSDMLSIEASILVCDIQMTCVLHLQATLMFRSCFWQAYNELIVPNAYILPAELWRKSCVGIPVSESNCREISPSALLSLGGQRDPALRFHPAFQCKHPQRCSKRSLYVLLERGNASMKHR